MHENSVAWNEMEDLLIRLGDALKRPTSLVVIGSSVCMSLGQAERMTMDVDVWRKDSVYDLGDLKNACKAVGIVFNPTGFDEPDAVYLQMVEPGIVQLGVFDETSSLLKAGNLDIRRPPIENVIASKLVRGEARDFDDSVFLLKKCRVSLNEVETAVASIFNKQARENAIENIVMLRACLWHEQTKNNSLYTLEKAVSRGIFYGPILSIEGNTVIQSAGQSKTVTHDAHNLDVIPAIGSSITIAYVGGHGSVTEERDGCCLGMKR